MRQIEDHGQAGAVGFGQLADDRVQGQASFDMIGHLQNSPLDDQLAVHWQAGQSLNLLSLPKKGKLALLVWASLP